MVYSGTWEKLIHEKNQKSKTHDTVPLTNSTTIMGLLKCLKRPFCEILVIKVLRTFTVLKCGSPGTYLDGLELYLDCP
jgi:hypothetical protein